ncbi:hypothetical protein WA158_005401 [Blastocystis sp. Blastoise]
MSSQSLDININNDNETFRPISLIEPPVTSTTFGQKVVTENRKHGLMFGPFLPIDFSNKNDASHVSFSVKYINKDLQLLLRVPFIHFMSHFLYDDEFKLTLLTFFEYMPRVYDEVYVSNSIKDTYSLIFRCFLRLVEDQQGIKQFISMSPSCGGLGTEYYSILKEKCGINMTLFLDLCSIYGEKNKITLNRFLQPLLTSPIYITEFQSFSSSVSTNISDVISQLRSRLNEDEYINTLMVLADVFQATQQFMLCYPDVTLLLLPSIQSMDDANCVFTSLRTAYNFIKNIKLYDQPKSLALTAIQSFALNIIKSLYIYNDNKPDPDVWSELFFHQWINRYLKASPTNSLDSACIHSDLFKDIYVYISPSIPVTHSKQVATALDIDLSQSLPEEEDSHGDEPENDDTMINGKVISEEMKTNIAQVMSIFPDIEKSVIYKYLVQYNGNVNRLVDDILNNKINVHPHVVKNSEEKESKRDNGKRTFKQVLSDLFNNREIEEKPATHFLAGYDPDVYNEASDEPDCNLNVDKYRQFQKRLLHRYEYADEYDEDLEGSIPMEENPNHKLQEEDNQEDDLPAPEEVSAVSAKNNGKTTGKNNEMKDSRSNQNTRDPRGNDSRINSPTLGPKDKNRGNVEKSNGVANISNSMNKDSVSEGDMNETKESNSENTNTVNNKRDNKYGRGANNRGYKHVESHRDSSVKANNTKKQNNNNNNNTNNNNNNTNNNNSINTNNNTPYTPTINKDTTSLPKTGNTDGSQKADSRGDRREKKKGFQHDNHNRKEGHMRKMNRGMI